MAKRDDYTEKTQKHFNRDGYSKGHESHYSKATPFGPYQGNERPRGAAGQRHIEGLASKSNLAKWSARASENSGPKQMPGTGSGPSGDRGQIAPPKNSPGTSYDKRHR
jgi:hypothetical protein